VGAVAPAAWAIEELKASATMRTTNWERRRCAAGLFCLLASPSFPGGTGMLLRLDMGNLH
jgi:hypothetical protein